MTILTYSSTDYAYIRSLIDIRLEEDDIPDDVISSLAFLGSSEQETLKLLRKAGKSVSSTEDLTTDEEADVRLSTLLRTAAFLVPNVPQMLQQTVGAIRHSWEDSNWERLQANLLIRANKALDDITEEENESVSITAFKTASSGRRGTWQ